MLYLDKVLAQHFVAREARDRCRLVVPLVDEPVGVDAKDGRVGRVDECLQLLRNACLLHLHLLPLRDVLPHPYHSDHVAADVSSRRGVEQHLNPLPIFCVEGKLEVGCSLALQGIVEHLPNRCTEVCADVHLNKILAKNLCP